MAPGGRSTGCKTCRMRHLKCDETRPSCQRCEKGGFECRGYDVIDVFVDERTRILERGRKAREERRQPSELALIRRPRAAARAQKSDALRLEGSPKMALPTAADSRQTSAYLPLTALFPLNEDEIYLTFMRNKLTANIPVFRLDNRFQLMDHKMALLSWLAPPLDGHTLTSPLHPALHALARAWFARLQDQPEIAAQGTMYYGKALRELKDTISNDRWRGRDVLITAMCLILYEAVELTVYDAWLNHARGLAQLIRAQGPECFQDKPGLGILQGMRLPIIMSAMARNVPIFLEYEDWCTIPWQVHPEYKNEADHLFDIFAKVPRLMNRLRAWENDSSADVGPILEDLLARLHQVCEWRWSYEITRPNCAWIDDSDGAETTSLFAHSIQFASLYDSHVLSNYNALFILLLVLVKRATTQALTNEQMVPPLVVGLVKSNPLLLPGFDALDQVSVAREICQILRFRLKFMEDNKAAFGLFFAVRMAWMVLRDHPADEKWLAGVAARFDRLSGVQFSKLVFWPAAGGDRQSLSRI